MREIGCFEPKNKLGPLLDWVENGEEVLGTVKPIEASRGVTLEGLKIKDRINEGRYEFGS